MASQPQEGCHAICENGPIPRSSDYATLLPLGCFSVFHGGKIWVSGVCLLAGLEAWYATFSFPGAGLPEPAKIFSPLGVLVKQTSTTRSGL